MLISPPDIRYHCLCMYCKSYFIASCNSSCYPYMHLFMHPRLQWELNTALGFFNEISRHTETHTHACTPTHSHTHASTHTCTHASTHTHTRVRAYSPRLSLCLFLIICILFPTISHSSLSLFPPPSFLISSTTLIFTPSFHLNCNSVWLWYLHIWHKQLSYLYYSRQPSFVLNSEQSWSEKTGGTESGRWSVKKKVVRIRLTWVSHVERMRDGKQAKSSCPGSEGNGRQWKTKIAMGGLH